VIPAIAALRDVMRRSWDDHAGEARHRGSSIDAANCAISIMSPQSEWPRRICYLGASSWCIYEIRAMRALSELNLNERGRPVVRPAPTNEAFEAFERHFDVKLPADYMGFMIFSNGGHPELDSIEPIGRPGAARRSVDHFYHFGDDKNSPSNIWNATEVWRPIIGNMAVPFAVDGGGNPFVLDFSKAPPSARACVHDEDFEVVDIAPSFSRFIDRLGTDPDMS
jgi:hypothetical protein